MTRVSRRGFVAAFASAAALAVPLAAAPRRAQAAAPVAGPRVLRFDHLHTGERLELEYFSAGHYLPDALDAANRLLRDFRTGTVGAMDPQLLDLLHRLAQATGTQRPFQIISGYRSPATNDMLRGRSRGVATKSLHMTGQAIDIRLGDVPLPALRDAALAQRLGGVGYYAGSNFVHVDTGRVRAW